MKKFLGLLIIMCLSVSTNLYALHNDETFSYDEEEINSDKGYVETSEEFESETNETQEFDVDMRPYISFKYTSSKKTINK